jgi:hypothetical protein
MTGEEFISLLPREAGEGDRDGEAGVVEGAQGGYKLAGSGSGTPTTP